jgi:carboxymethylenebutenolidase
MKIILAVIATVAAVSSSAAIAHAERYCSKFKDSDPVPPGSVRSYLQLDDVASSDTRASPFVNIVTGAITWNVDLKGYLFRPPVTFSAPVIVYSHGGTAPAKPPCAMVHYFVSRGYVFFAPQRRGEAPSTGVDLDDWVVSNPGTTAVDYIVIQASDIVNAALWARTLPGVNPARVALMGHSNGGFVSMVANTRVGPGPLYLAPHHATVDISAAGLTWCTNGLKQEALFDAVERPLRPFFLLQAANEPCNPTDPLDDAATAAGATHWAHIFPPVPNTVTPGDAHNWFVRDATQIALWGPEVIAFLQTF